MNSSDVRSLGNRCAQRLRRLTVGGLGLALCVAAASRAPGEDWPRWRGPDANGVSREKGWFKPWPATGPKQIWKASIGTGFSSMAVSGGRVFAMGNQGDKQTVYCLAVDTGKEVWKHTYDAPLDPNLYEGGPNATPTVDGDAVYTLSRQGHVHALAATDGKVVWSKNLTKELGLQVPDWGFSGSVLVHGDLLILNVGAAGVALHKKSGEVAWKTGPEKSGYSTPLLFQFKGAPAVAIFAASNVVAQAPESGKELWRFPWKTSYGVNAADPVASGGWMYLSSGYGSGATVIDVSGDQPKEVWRHKKMRNMLNSSVLVNGFLFGIDGDVKNRSTGLNCVDPKTGTLKWSGNETSVGGGSLIAADGKLIILSETGELIIAEASPVGFKALARASILQGKCWTAPVLANGRIFARNATGDLVCVSASGR